MNRNLQDGVSELAVPISNIYPLSR